MAPNFAKEFKLTVDASDTGAGSVLIQENGNGVDHPVSYFTKTFKQNIKRFTPTMLLFPLWFCGAGGSGWGRGMKCIFGLHPFLSIAFYHYSGVRRDSYHDKARLSSV